MQVAAICTLAGENFQKSKIFGLVAWFEQEQFSIALCRLLNRALD